MQHPHGVVAGREDRELAGDGVELADVRDEPAELQAVRVEPGHDVLHVADGGRGGGQQTGVPRLGECALVDGGGGERADRGQRGEAGSGRGKGGPPPAKDQQPQQGRAEHRHQDGTDDERLQAVPQVLVDLRTETPELLGVRDDRPRRVPAQLVDPHPELDRTGVGVQPQLAERGDRDGGAARQRRTQRHVSQQQHG
jgi:hypothetical protein